MTKNQIEYLKVLENQRSNRENERQTRVRDSNTHFVQLGNLHETSRANRAREAETERSNRAREFETTRTNYANERLREAELDERRRANYAQEDIDRERNSINRGQLEVSKQQAQIAHLNYFENVRANMARETETRRSNIAREQETARSNRASENEALRSHKVTENLRQKEISLGYSRLAEDRRSNLAREQETMRSNQAREEELHRSNVRNESLTEQRNLFEHQYQNRQAGNSAYANQIREKALAETMRSNVAAEGLKDRQQGLDFLSSVSRTAMVALR